MRMKQICEQTGLTDRAVRLYIENGLISPERVSGYSGRDRITFGEREVEILRGVATLRKAGFSIADIRQMQQDSGSIAGIVAAHRAALSEDIRRKQEIAALLSEIDPSRISGARELAGLIQKAADAQNIPKEDVLMSAKEFNQKLIRYALALPSLLFMLLSCAWTGAVIFRALLYYNGGITLKPGGNYEFTNTFSLSWLGAHWIFIPVALCGAAAAAACLIYILRGNKNALTAASAATVLYIILLLVMPQASRELFYSAEFMLLRLSVGLNMRQISPALKYIPAAISLILSATALIASYRAERANRS